MFCWPCIIVYQYNETNMMHFSFSLFRIKGLYMFQPLLAHLQKALHNSIWYIACVLCQLAVARLQWNCNCATDIISTQYTKCVSAAPPEDEQVMVETCRAPWFSIHWMRSASCSFHYTDVYICLTGDSVLISKKLPQGNMPLTLTIALEWRGGQTLLDTRLSNLGK
jgi:hypothetical protein